MQFLVLATLFLAAAEATPWGGWYYGYWPRHYYHSGYKYAKLAPASIANIDYGKTGIKYLKKRSAEADPGVSAPFPANIKMEDIDYGKTKIKYLTKRSLTKREANPGVTAILPKSSIKMENIDYGKTQIKYLSKRSADPKVTPVFGPIKMEDIDYGKTQIKYLSKRSADASPWGGWYYGYWPRYYGHSGYKLYKPASIANIDYGKTGIKYGV